MTARVQVLKNVQTGDPQVTHEWELCFQWCRYFYDDGGVEHGYRFIWKRPDGSLQAARGQARLPSYDRIKTLMDQAEKEGWGSYDADEIDA